jgi:predicted DCC family thiol-disulfide oxidoreductase YuxK
MTTPLPIFLYDDDCGVCHEGTTAIRARVRPPIALVPYQSVDTGALGVSDEVLAEGPVLVQAGGRISVGPAAMAGLLRASRRPYRWLGITMDLPGIKQILAAAGPHMYRQRHRLPGASGSCAVPPTVRT